jgi:hypothetical protein
MALILTLNIPAKSKSFDIIIFTPNFLTISILIFNSIDITAPWKKV